MCTSPRMREDGAVARAGDLEDRLLLARVVHRHQVLAAVLDPFHRALDVAGRERDQEILRIELAARAVAAADVVLDHLDLLDRQADLRRQNAAVEERHLGGAGDRELALGLVPLGHDAARLHGEAVVAAGAHAARGARRAHWQRPRRRRPCARGTPASGWCPASSNSRLLFLRRHGPVGDRRQFLDLDRRSRRARPRRSATLVGQHHGDRLADVAHLVVGDHRLLERLELRQRLQPHRHDRRAARHVVRGDDGVHARHASARPRHRCDLMRPCATELRRITA